MVTVDYSFFQGNLTDSKIPFFIIFSKKLQLVKKDIENRLALLARETEEIFADLTVLDAEMLQKKGKGWSVIQVLSHLNMAESLSLSYMKKKVQAGEKMARIGVINNIRMWVTCGFLTTGLKWKAPSYISQPDGNHTLQEVSDLWTSTRKEIGRYIDEYPADLLDRAVYKHPMAGRLSLMQAIDSFIYHQRHHVHQIRRIRKELGF